MRPFEHDMPLEELNSGIRTIESMMDAGRGPWFSAIWGSVYVRLKRERQRRALLRAAQVLGRPS